MDNNPGRNGPTSQAATLGGSSLNMSFGGQTIANIIKPDITGAS